MGGEEGGTFWPGSSKPKQNVPRFGGDDAPPVFSDLSAVIVYLDRSRRAPSIADMPRPSEQLPFRPSSHSHFPTELKLTSTRGSVTMPSSEG